MVVECQHMSQNSGKPEERKWEGTKEIMTENFPELKKFFLNVSC